MKIETPIVRPWGELLWTLGLSDIESWYFLGCLSTEERSVEPLITLNGMELIQGSNLFRIHDSFPEDSVKEEAEIALRLKRCEEEKCEFDLDELQLLAPINNSFWVDRLLGISTRSLCIDVSCFPKRFFFPLLKAAIQNHRIENLLVLYSKPLDYPAHELSSNHSSWKAIPGFLCSDPDIESVAAEHLIVSPGFAVEGLMPYLNDCDNRIKLDVLIPFPAEPWTSVRRSWISAREIEESLQLDEERIPNATQPTYHRVGALDTSTAFDNLLQVTGGGKHPAALAPLGPKPISIAMCLLACQTEMHPVYYAQPKSYAVNYSIGYEKTFAYWVRHKGNNFYSV